jgi:hypothetical protein
MRGESVSYAGSRRGCLEGSGVIPSINGRPVISRADMAARGVPSTTVNGWYRNRAVNGHPEKAGRIGRTDYWYEDEWMAWREQHVRGRLESLTRPDREGDPDELVDADGVARILGYASRRVIHANRRLGYFPEPDAYGTARNGRPAPLWKRSTVWAVADGRVGDCTMITAPPVRRRLVGGTLRRYRESLGLDLEDAARVLGFEQLSSLRTMT